MIGYGIYAKDTALTRGMPESKDIRKLPANLES
jgi:hypothetical protein